jgi:hypothetical protein
VFLNYRCILSPSISPDNREYTVVPTILVESPKVPRRYEPLNPALDILSEVFVVYRHPSR